MIILIQEFGTSCDKDQISWPKIVCILAFSLYVFFYFSVGKRQHFVRVGLFPMKFYKFKVFFILEESVFRIYCKPQQW